VQLGDFTIAYYGMIIAAGMVLGYLLAYYQAKRTGQDPTIYTDVAILGIILAIIGARVYYVVFSWDYYKEHLMEILNIRGGGLAIYGGIIGGVLAALIISKVKKYPFLLIADTAACSLLVGQAVGRWGNFINREAFGGYTNSIFSMQVKLSDVNIDELTGNLGDHLVNVGGVNYIQVHPTFFYESMWNLCLLIVLFLYSKRKKFDGEIFGLYIMGYALGRIWIEALRTDQLMIGGTKIPVSMALSIAIVVIVGIIMAINYFNYFKKRQTVADVPKDSDETVAVISKTSDDEGAKESK
jgi:phosphatidylglycerol:prolipoprotein diacylglycerol transferase